MKTKKNFLSIFVLCFIGTGLLFLLPGSPLNAEKPDTPPEQNRMEPDHAPTPFSAEEIREGCPTGRTSKYLIEVAGNPNSFQLMSFTNSDKDGTDFESITLDNEGTQTGEKKAAGARWDELQSHASFPETDTLIKSEFYTTPVGEFNCWHYVVKKDNQGKKEVTHYWFAKSLPGPPVFMEQIIEGKTVFKMTLVENTK